jgi:hypothetical protein
MKLRILFLALLLCAACGGKKNASTPTEQPGIAKGFETPDALGKAVIDAVGNSAAVDGLFPSEALLKITADCSGENPMIKEIETKREQCRRQLTELPPEMGPVTYDRVESMREAKEFKPGDKKANCVFKLPVVSQRYRHFANTTMKGKPRPLKEGVRLIKIGDYGWYLYSF